MPVLGAVVVLIQFCFAFHVLRSGRPYWWIFIIMAFPVMGCVIYYFVEVFPGSREHRRANRAARTLARVLQPDADLRKERRSSRSAAVSTTGSPSPPNA